MQTLLNELVKTFERISVLYDELLETAKKKRRCLISGDIEELETLIYQERNKLEMVQLLEEKRQNLANRYSEARNIQGCNITMKSLLADMEEPYRKKLSNFIEKLTQSVTQLRELNEMNIMLTQYSLDITDDLLKIFCPPAFVNPVYQNTGKMQSNELSRVLIDTKM